MTRNLTEHTEGNATFKIGNAFYRPGTQVVRDLGVLAAAIYKFQIGHLRVIDAMSGCGVRSLRYSLESQADWIWVNEGNPELKPILQQNLAGAIASHKATLTHLDANQVFFECYNRRDYYDFIDVDCFGSPTPYLDTSLWALKLGGLLYLTSTDGRKLTGHASESSLGIYGAYPRNHPAAQEQGLRVVIGKLQQQAIAKGLGIEPIFSLFTGQTYRLMVRLVKTQPLTLQNYGFLGYCHHCGNYQTVSWRQLGRVVCAYDQKSLTLSGPLWLGLLHNQTWLRQMQELAAKWHWSKRVQLLSLMEAEADFPPYFYTLAEIGRRGRLDIPKRENLIQALRDRGYFACATHITPGAIKTNADIHTCIAVALNSVHCTKKC